MSINLPERPTVDYTASGVDDANLLRRRLLGAAVLIALAVIFLPLLLDGSGTESRFRRVEQLRVEPPRIIDSEGRIEVPPKTSISSQTDKPEADKSTQDTSTVAAPAATPTINESVKLPLPTEPARASAAAPVAAAAAEATVNEIPKVPAVVPAPTEVAPAAASDGKIQNLVAWIVQAGSFSAEANALTLRDRLREAGYPAFVSAASTDASLYRVKVGPITDREKALDVQARVQTLLGYKTLVRQYP